MSNLSSIYRNKKTKQIQCSDCLLSGNSHVSSNLEYFTNQTKNIRDGFDRFEDPSFFFFFFLCSVWENPWSRGEGGSDRNKPCLDKTIVRLDYRLVRRHTNVAVFVRIAQDLDRTWKKIRVFFTATWSNYGSSGQRGHVPRSSTCIRPVVRGNKARRWGGIGNLTFSNVMSVEARASDTTTCASETDGSLFLIN